MLDYAISNIQQEAPFARQEVCAGMLSTGRLGRLPCVGMIAPTFLLLL